MPAAICMAFCYLSGLVMHASFEAQFWLAAQTHTQELDGKYGVQPYRAKALQKLAGKRAGVVARFCQRIGMDDLELLFVHLQVLCVCR